MPKKEEGLTAAEEIILAAYNLFTNLKEEFSEWDLTVKAWELNKSRWGLQGYENKYPNHKRVMVVIMTRGDTNVLDRGWMKRTRENHYKITDLGKAKAKALSNISQNKRTWGRNEYESIKRYIFHKVFEDYCKDLNEPKTWLGVADF